MNLISKLALYKTKNEFEKKGITRDLEIILQKLEKGEYKKGFVAQNKFDIVSRTEGLFRELEFLMQLGHDWEQVLKILHIKKDSEIVDLCPGYTPKIELGLYYLNFKGKISLLDKDLKSIKNLERFINLYNPKFTIVKEQKDLFSHKSTYDFVLGNHIVDDLTVYYFCRKLKIPLTKFYADEQTAEKVWKKILENPEKNSAEISQKIAKALNVLTRKKGYLCLAQYKSYSEKLFGMKDSYEFNKKVFQKIQKELTGYGFTQDNKTVESAYKNYKGHIKKSDFIILIKNDN